MADADQIKVVIRVRPLIKREFQNGQECRWKVKNEKSISQIDQSHLPAYVFDQIFDRDCTLDLYSCIVAPIVESAMNGYHGTVFAYGQSGSGKTHTMSGCKQSPGIVALAMQDIFDFIEQKPSHEFLMRASYMEIYTEKIFDLLSNEERNLKLHESGDHQISVNGLEEVLVNSCDQVFSVIQRAEARRTVAETKQNDRSSRSHCIFRIIIESRRRNEVDAAVMVSHLNFVDLAGSEKAGENSGDRFKEGCAINKSLFCLSQVISKLSEGESNQFIPYRDSKLTRILQNALGGNSKTAIICTVNPTAVEETHSTLRFATRAKTIKNKPHVNEVLSEAAMLKKYRNEISRLQKMVTEMGVEDMQMANEDLKKQLEEKKELIKQLTQQIVVSSALPESVSFQKKKMRRETWCAPKLRRKSHFPSLSSFLDQRKITIQEETCLDLDHSATDVSAFGLESLAIKQKHISFSLDNELRAKDFLRLSEGNEMLDLESNLDEDIENLMPNMELKDESEKPLFEEEFILKDELLILQDQLHHAEKQNERMDQELVHLCDKRFDLDLLEWQALMDENKKLQEDLMIKIKEVQDLEKALTGQEPYIARLEAQLEAQMGTSNGHLGIPGKRRSGIPVAVKKEGQQVPMENNHQTNQEFDVKIRTSADGFQKPQSTFQATMSAEDLLSEQHTTITTTDELLPQQFAATTSTEELQQPWHTVEATTSTEDFRSLQQTVTTSADLRSQQNTWTCLEGFSQMQHMADATTSTDDLSLPHYMGMPPTENFPLAQLTNEQLVFVEVGVVTEHSFTTSKCCSSAEADAKTPREDQASLAHVAIKEFDEKSTGTDDEMENPAEFVLEGSTKLSRRLQEKDLEVQQLHKQALQLGEILNQANAENMRLKEALEVLEQADAERLEEMNELPKLKALLTRRNMEIQRLEFKLDCLKEEVGHTSFNSSTLSPSVSEAPRQSMLLAECEEEVWQLKERLVSQAQETEDLRQEKLHLEDLVIDLRAQLDQKARGLPSVRTRMSGCSNSSYTPFETSFEREIEQEVLDQSQKRLEEADVESLQRKIYEQGSQISRLEALLQEKDEDVEILFDRNMIIPKDVAETRIKEMEEQRKQLESVTEMLDDRNQELVKVKASLELYKCQEASPRETKENSFQENLILEKMDLEEALQEKTEQLEAALEDRKELELKLDERRCVINELRQQLEELEERLEEGRSLPAKNCSSPRVLGVMIDVETSTVQPPVENPSHTSLSEYEELLKSLKAREQELLRSLEMKEKEIAQLKTMLSSPLSCSSQGQDPEVLADDGARGDEHLPNKGALEVVPSQVQVSRNGEMACGDQESQRIAASEVQMKLQELAVLVEEKLELERKLQQMSSVMDEKIALEAKVEELSSLAAEKDDLDSRFQELNLAVTDKIALELKVRELLILSEKDENHLESEMGHEASLIEALDGRLEKLKVQFNRQSTAEENFASLEHSKAALAAGEKEKAELDEKTRDLETEVKSLQRELEQSQAVSEELKAELTWQTQAAETLQAKMENLQEELAKHKQEADADVNRLTQEVEDALQELEKTNGLLESSEQCRRVTEETLEEYKQNFDRLETSLQKLAQERDEFELKLYAANKDQEKRCQKMDELQGRISGLERELHNALHSKRLLEGVLADKESAHRMGESLHENLSRELQDSQTEVLSMQEQLTQLSLALQRQETTCARLKTANCEMEADVQRLTQVEANLQKENAGLKSLVETHNNKVAALEEELQALKDIRKEKEALCLQVEDCHTEISQLQEEVANLQHESKMAASKIQALKAENMAYLTTRDELDAKIHTLQEEVNASMRVRDELVAKMQALQEENEVAVKNRNELVTRIQALQKGSRASLETRTEVAARLQVLQEEHKAILIARDYLTSRVQCLEEQNRQKDSRNCQLRETMDQVAKDKQEAAEKVAGLEAECQRLRENSCQLQQLKKGQKESTSEKLVPALEFKQMKCLFRSQIRDLKMDLEKKNNVILCQKDYIKDLQDQIEKFENRDDAESKEKKLEDLANTVKRKDYEAAHQKLKHQKELEALSQRLKNAEDTVGYKESCISKLKDEIRRMRSEDMSFCTPVSSTKENLPQAPVTPEKDRVISSHSGIIDRYTVTLLEADKYRLQRELKKMQERLKKTEAELHWAKVSLSKFTTGNDSVALPTPKADTSKSAESPDSRPASCSNISSRDVSPCLKPLPITELRSPVVPVLRSLGDRLPSVEKPVMNCAESESFILNKVLSPGGSADVKKDRLPLRSVNDNAALRKEENRAATSAEIQTAESGESKVDPLKIDLDIWKKPKQPSVLKSYTRPSNKLLGSKAGQGADQCKQQ